MGMHLALLLLSLLALAIAVGGLIIWISVRRRPIRRGRRRVNLFSSD